MLVCILKNIRACQHYKGKYYASLYKESKFHNIYFKSKENKNIIRFKKKVSTEQVKVSPMRRQTGSVLDIT